MTNIITLKKDFFFGGNCTFTIKSEKSGEWRTFRIRRPKDKDIYFAQLLAGPDNENSFVYVGIVDIETGKLRLTKNSKRTEQSPDVVILRWFLSHLFSDGQLQNAVVMPPTRCGCCGRTLTVPESILTGLGPECAKRFRL